MSPASRRILCYWLLLLVPTLLAGAGAMFLLRREQDRLAAQTAQAGEARRATVTARAGLIVENIELLVGDVQTGLLDTLASMPEMRIDDELALWERSNPLVRTAFRCSADGRIIRPSTESGDEAARAFRRRFGPLLEENSPWRRPAELQAGRDAMRDFEETGSSNEKAARQQALSNVEQYQQSRREIKATSVSKDYRQEAAAPAVNRLEDRFRQDEQAAVRKSGWTPWSTDNRLHLIGWVEKPAEDKVLGVELEMSALISRLGASLPRETGSDEGYALHDEKGRTMHQAGWIPRGPHPVTARLPLAANTLPGWTVVAFVDAPLAPGATGGGFLLIGSLLVATLIVAILAGGSLLLFQARRSEAEAAQKTSFVANVSHEFKTPLTTIRLYAELLEQGRVPEEAKRGEYLRTIGRETQRLARLVGNALDFSRLEQGQKKYERESIELRSELGRLLDTHEPRISESGLRLRRSMPAGVLKIETDRDAVEQIVLNLLDNASKYAAGGGEVAVELEPGKGTGAVIRVLDRGPGVPADHRERIFEKFHRVNDTLTAEKTGTGLGLSIARQLARGLGGDLRYEPRDGSGSVFVLELR